MEVARGVSPRKRSPVRIKKNSGLRTSRLLSTASVFAVLSLIAQSSRNHLTKHHVYPHQRAHEHHVHRGGSLARAGCEHHWTGLCVGVRHLRPVGKWHFHHFAVFARGGWHFNECFLCRSGSVPKRRAQIGWHRLGVGIQRKWPGRKHDFHRQKKSQIRWAFRGGVDDCYLDRCGLEPQCCREGRWHCRCVGIQCQSLPSGQRGMDLLEHDGCK